ncbi:cache domain-containing sensor histidine kinase [Metabacillus malikii]|uniref:histidine kinase n=1 Tax=Metabacillus malikii TaxID=1504265 RepID=A0ABT9ZAU3_9BACI|nr:sensor histidine kinase [Metabacillus malikii]MDQ0229378.1 two-component system sensor histidine kinase YesM [Metabacillus malikii]
MKLAAFKLNNLPIRHKIIALLLIISILPAIGLGLLTAFTVEKIIDKRETEHTLQLIDQVNKKLEVYVSNMQNVSYLLSMDPEIKKFLTEHQKMRTEDEEYSIRQFIQGLSTLYPEVASILIVNHQGHYISNDLYTRTSINLTKEQWYGEAVENKGIFNIIGHPKNRNLASHVNYKDNEVVTVVRAILEPETQKVQGVVLIDLKLRVIAEATKTVKLGKTGYLMVVDDKGEEIYSPRKRLIDDLPIKQILKEDSGFFSEESNGNKLQFIYKKQPFTNWTTVGVFSAKELVVEVRTIHFFVICFVFLIIIFGIAASFYLSDSMSKPIIQLMSVMKKVETGNLGMRYKGNREDEIGKLGQSFNAMISKINDLLIVTEQQERKKREAELRSLQAHIQPHFLYNTLDTISWMARKQGASDVAQVVNSLSRLFRIGLNNGKDMVTLAEEIAHIHSYLSIQKARYRDKLNYSIEFDEELGNLQVVKLILQPIVENAIYHGIKERKGPGLIVISAKTQEDKIFITVQDDGKGIESDKLAILQSKLNTFSVMNEDRENSLLGYGMMNVQSRIKLTYGEEYGLSIQSEPQKGTIVIISLPMIEGKR